MTFFNKQILSDLVAISFFLILSCTMKAQNGDQSYGSEEKFHFEEIILDTSQNKAQLYTRGIAWLIKNFNASNIVSSSDSSILSNKGSFKVYNKGLVSKEVHGEIHFDVSISFKDNKYKYIFSNFNFEYYKQNRQYKYVPTGKYKSLQDENFPGWQSSWDRYKKETKSHIEKYISDLKQAMKYQETTNQFPKSEW